MQLFELKEPIDLETIDRRETIDWIETIPVSSQHSNHVSLALLPWSGGLVKSDMLPKLVLHAFNLLQQQMQEKMI